MEGIDTKLGVYICLLTIHNNQLIITSFTNCL